MHSNSSGEGLTIIGAGLSGLLAACAWPCAKVFEASPKPNETHKALLRFRSQAVANLTQIPFQEVLVRKGIWWNGAFREPSIALANAYATKTLGLKGLSGGERSIWNIDPVKRYVAPDDFYQRLLARVGERVFWDAPLSETHIAHQKEFWLTQKSPAVSTIPLPALIAMAGISVPDVEFVREQIFVTRYTLPGVDLYQTVYFPGDDTFVYRASFTGSTLIVESIGMPGKTPQDFLYDTLDAFGLSDRQGDFQFQEAVSQKFGKIKDIPTNVRRKILFDLSHDFGIYSLGRFATWRNILLDDVASDIEVIKQLMASDGYQLRRKAT